MTGLFSAGQLQRECIIWPKRAAKRAFVNVGFVHGKKTDNGSGGDGDSTYQIICGGTGMTFRVPDYEVESLADMDGRCGEVLTPEGFSESEEIRASTAPTTPWWFVSACLWFCGLRRRIRS